MCSKLSSQWRAEETRSPGWLSSEPIFPEHNQPGCVIPASESEAGNHKLKASPGYIVTLLSNKTKSWGYNSVVEHIPRMYGLVGSLPSTAKRKMNK